MMLFQSKNLLITGGMGFIGSNFIHYILSNNPTIFIVNLDLETYAANIQNLSGLIDSSRHKLIKGDIKDRKLLDFLFAQYAFDSVINFAAESHVDRSISMPMTFINTNIVGTFQLLEAAKFFWQEKMRWPADHCRFYHISTDEIYGSCTDLSQPAFTECNAYDPRSPYSASKAASNHLVKAFSHTYGLPIIISNCTNNFGPRQHTEKFIPKIIQSCLNGDKIPIYGDGSNIRDWLYVDDHCIAIEKILNRGQIGQEYNISAGNEMSNLDVAKIICTLMDQHFPQKNSYHNLITYVTDRPGHDWRYSLNADKIKNDIGWHSKTTFMEGLCKTIDFYVKKNSACYLAAEAF